MAFFLRRIPVGGKDQKRHVGLGGAIQGAARHLGPEGIGDIGNDQAQHARAPRAHAHRQVVALIAHGPRRCQHALARLGQDILARRQRPRRGALGHPRALGHINDRGTAFPH